MGCPSRWRDLQNAIQVNWTSPQDPNGIVRQYYLALTSYAGNTVIATESVNSSGNLTTEFNARLGEHFWNDGFFTVSHLHLHIYVRVWLDINYYNSGMQLLR